MRQCERMCPMQRASWCQSAMGALQSCSKTRVEQAARQPDRSYACMLLQDLHSSGMLLRCRATFLSTGQLYRGKFAPTPQAAHANALCALQDMRPTRAMC